MVNITYSPGGTYTLEKAARPVAEDRYLQLNNMTRYILILLLTNILPSFQKAENPDVFKNYQIAMNNSSNDKYYVVFKMKNLKTGETRENCTISNLLKGALYIEYGVEFEKEELNKIDSVALNNKQRYFEFKNQESIQNFDRFHSYSIEELNKLEQEINFDSLASTINHKGHWQMDFKEEKKLRMYAHCLLNRGILIMTPHRFGNTLEMVKN